MVPSRPGQFEDVALSGNIGSGMTAADLSHAFTRDSPLGKGSLHIHLILRRDGGVENPPGRVRRDFWNNAILGSC